MLSSKEFRLAVSVVAVTTIVVISASVASNTPATAITDYPSDTFFN